MSTNVCLWVLGEQGWAKEIAQGLVNRGHNFAFSCLHRIAKKAIFLPHITTILELSLKGLVLSVIRENPLNLN